MTNRNDQHDLDKLGRMLNSPAVPADLQSRLLKNLERQINDEKRVDEKQKPKRVLLVSSIAASFLVGLAIVLQSYLVSSPVDLAYEHAAAEQQLSGFIDGGYQDWMEDNGIALPVNAEAIVLSKNCLLGDVRTKHLRFELNSNSLPSQLQSSITQKGVINVFVNASLENTLSMPDDSGRINGQHWRLFKFGTKMEVLVLYNNEAYQTAVNEIIKSMFTQQDQNIIKAAFVKLTGYITRYFV